MTRYKILDELLSSRYHNYSLDDLTEEVSNRLADMYPDTHGVVRRTIEKDIYYLEYEGPVSAGRGTVVRWDEGDFQWVEKNAGCIVVDLKGEKIVGRVRIDSGAETGDVCWYLTTV